jgi:hypothetical protein
MQEQEDWVAFDTRDISRYVTVRAENWLDARKKGKRELKIPLEFVNAGKNTAGMIDHDFDAVKARKRK